MKIKRFNFLVFLIVVVLPVGCQNEAEQDDLAGSRPNILFAIADDASFPHFGAYGCDWVKTPAFDRVAEQGILFMNAYTPNAKCAPSRAAILTGRNSWQLEEAGNHWPYFPDKFTTFAEVLGENGYHVGYTTKGFAPGIVGEVNGKKRQLTGRQYNARTLEPPTPYISTSDYTANFEDFLSERPENTPFMFWYGSIEPHRRYEFQSGIKLGNKRPEEIDKVPDFWPDVDSVRLDMLDYAFEIEYFDQHLQNMLTILDQKGELENTLVVVTSDNGMPFPRVKGQAYEMSNHLPLAIMWPNGINNPGRKVEDFVSFIDFAPTFLELAGINEKENRMEPITGKTLIPLLASEKEGKVTTERNFVLIGKERHDIGRPHDWGYPIRGIVTDEYLFIKNYEPDRWPAGNPETGYLNTDGGATKTYILNARRSGRDSSYWQLNFGKRMGEELYQVSRDPDCVENLALHPEFQDIKKQLEEQMIGLLKEQGDPRMFGKGAVFDEYAYANKSGRGFYQKYMDGDTTLNWGWVNDSDFEKEPVSQ
ncbi:MAG: sulfatase family protein [Candidatus Cyclobacteriaceae bacterium M3_2C_046]